VARLETLLTEQQIQDKVGELARQIAGDHPSGPLLLVGVLKGSFVFLSDLARQLGPEVEVDFVQTSSYGEGTQSSGVVQIRKDLDVNIEGRDVLIVEDILDTGLTLAHLRDLLGTRRPRSLKVVTLLRKPGAVRHGTQAEYVGFDIPDVFVVGYGLDHAERYRNLPYVAVLHQEV
jgi:hypoxanthine phosphoribosyltransferase